MTVPNMADKRNIMYVLLYATANLHMQ